MAKNLQPTDTPPPTSGTPKHFSLLTVLVVLVTLAVVASVVWGTDIYLRKFLTLPVSASDQRIATDDGVLSSYLIVHGPEKAIMTIKAMPGVDCHQRVHKVGRLSYEIRGNDAFKVLNSECMSGYMHGVTEAFFHEHGTQNLSENLTLICQGEQNSFYSHQCFHGIGHGLMAYNDYDLPAALTGCDTLPIQGTSHESCYSGVFMENVVGAIAADKAVEATAGDFHYSQYLSDDPLYPCTAIEAKYQSSCYFFQSSRMIEIFGPNYKKVAASCGSIDEVHQTICFMSMGRDVDNTYGTDFKRIETSCYYAPREDLALACISGAAQDRFWHVSEQDDALSLCRALSSSAKSRCYSELTTRGRDIIPTLEAKQAFCDKYEESFKPMCVSSL